MKTKINQLIEMQLGALPDEIIRDCEGCRCLDEYFGDCTLPDGLLCTKDYQPNKKEKSSRELLAALIKKVYEYVYDMLFFNRGLNGKAYIIRKCRKCREEIKLIEKELSKYKPIYWDEIVKYLEEN